MRDETRLSFVSLLEYMHHSDECTAYCELFWAVEIEVWIHSHLFPSFDMVEAFFSDLPDELWYSNFRVTLGTFTYILNETGDEISPNRTFHAKSCYSKSTTRNSFVPIALSYLTSTAECRTTPGKQSWHHFILVLNFVQISPSKYIFLFQCFVCM